MQSHVDLDILSPIDLALLPLFLFSLIIVCVVAAGKNLNKGKAHLYNGSCISFILSSAPVIISSFIFSSSEREDISLQLDNVPFFLDFFCVHHGTA